MVIHPIRFGEELLGTLEVDHPKRHAYGTKDLLALSTLANQMATAITSPSCADRCSARWNRSVFR